MSSAFRTHRLLRNGLVMTLYTAFKVSRHWQDTVTEGEPIYQAKIFMGAGGVPIFGWVAIPAKPRGTIIGTYGITGDLNNQWFLRLMGRKAFARNYAIALFDWRGHGKTAQLSPTLTSDGLYEGEDFVRIAAQVKQMGCPAPFWFTGFSLGGQLALWAIQSAQSLMEWGQDLGLNESDIGGSAVICPNLDANRSLPYLEKHFLGRYIEKAITKELKKMAWQLHQRYPDDIDPDAIAGIKSIRDFDRELVIKPLGFSSVEDYYEASNALKLLPHLTKPTLILYAADDPLFAPTIIPHLQAACANNNAINLYLTAHGGHVGYLSDKLGQELVQDRDRWWAWNRVLEWLDRQIS